MKSMITYVNTLAELNQVKRFVESNCKVQIILGCKELSRFSICSKEDMISLSSHAKKNKIEVFLEWDVLNQENKFQRTIEIINSIPLENFDAIRVQDPGALEFIKIHYPWMKIHLILENNNHNLLAISTWLNYLGNQCTRVVLSNELSRDNLKKFASALQVSIEIQVYGRILLFYSPRKLLSPLDRSQLQESLIEAYGTSEESPHSGFPLIENNHGTFMFNVKDLSLLEHLDELKEFGIDFFRADLRFDQSFDCLLEEVLAFFEGTGDKDRLLSKMPHNRPLIKGFFNINKTDVLFSKLKNSRIQRNDLNYLGEVVDVEKDKQLTVSIKVNISSDAKLSQLRIVAPDGKEKIVELKWVKDSRGNIKTVFTKNDIVIIPFFNGITVKSQIYLV